MNWLRAMGAFLIVCCGWCAGGAFSSRLVSHEAALRAAVAVLKRVRREIAYRRRELSDIYNELCAEGILPQNKGSFASLKAPGELTKREADCFNECVSGLGRSAAEQECERLDLYIMRMNEFLDAAQNETERNSALLRKLGLAAGAVLALLFI